MPRLADDLLRDKILLPSWIDPDDPVDASLGDRLPAALREQLPNAPVIVADNVTQQYIDEVIALAARVDAGAPDRDHIDYAAEFPCLAAPYDTFWIESRTPAGLPMSGIGAWGALVHSDAFEPGDAAALAATALGEAPEGERYDVLNNAAWIQSWSFVHDYRVSPGPSGRTGPHVGLMSMSLFLDARGQILGEPSFMGFGGRRRMTQVSAQDMMNVTHMLAQPLLRALCFMHVPTVTLRQHAPRLPAKKGQQHRKPRRLLRYTTIEVTSAVKTRQAVAPSADQVEGGVALHLARGHFKDYRESGLFGRHRGVFWFGPQLRGQGHLGVVEKDYDARP